MMTFSSHLVPVIALCLLAAGCVAPQGLMEGDPPLSDEPDAVEVVVVGNGTVSGAMPGVQRKSPALLEVADGPFTAGRILVEWTGDTPAPTGIRLALYAGNPFNAAPLVFEAEGAAPLDVDIPPDVVAKFWNGTYTADVAPLAPAVAIQQSYRVTLTLALAGDQRAR